MRRQTYIVERFEDNGWAVLEDDSGETFNIPQTWLPEAVEEGDVMHATLEDETETSTLRFSIDPVATEGRRQDAAELRGSLTQAPEGDLKL